MGLVVLAVCTPNPFVDIVIQWRQKSELCPQCRVKLSVEEPFIRDYVLERISEKYAKIMLSQEEISQREVLAT
jgi:hypothetical protein